MIIIITKLNVIIKAQHNTLQITSKVADLPANIGQLIVIKTTTTKY